MKKKKTTEKTVWENCTPRSEINLHVETFLNVFSVSLYVCIVCMYAYAICTFRSSMVRLRFPDMTKPIEFVCKARPFGIIYSFLGTAEESSLWRCGHSWVPDKLLLLLLLFWLLSMQQQRFGTFLASLQAAAPLTDSHGSCSHLLGLAFLCYFVEVVMMVNSVLSLLPMGSDETTVLHYALHL